MRRSVVLSCLLAASLAATPLVHAADGTRAFGKPIPAGETLSIARAIADPAVHGGDARRFSGRIVSVCQKKGCWAMLEDDGAVARVFFPKHDVALPKDASGRAVVHGVLERVEMDRDAAEHFAAEDRTGRPVGEAEYRIVADGFEIAG
jgi:hypothetical protein